MRLLLTLLLLNLLFPHLIGVDVGEILPVVPVDNRMEVPLEDNVFGVMEDHYSSTVFFAHDYFAGNYVKDLVYQDEIYLLYSNGTKVPYKVNAQIWIEKQSPDSLYDIPGAAIFQTCDGDKILLVVTKRSE